ncbi:hypothetical protein K1719_035764 [Acacia pycnantha]|nr:hypothetical protein K1719_035764 [Acacia pycnantha]
MAEHTNSLNVEADQRMISDLLDRLESSLEGISRAMDSLTRNVDRFLHAQAIKVSGSGSYAQMPAPSPSFCHHQQVIRSEILTLFIYRLTFSSPYSASSFLFCGGIMLYAVGFFFSVCVAIQLAQ